MKTTVKIIDGKLGWGLKVNDVFISAHFDNTDIKGIKCDNCIVGLPYGATEWVSINALREFWHRYMVLINYAYNKPYESVNGFAKMKVI